ncbi:hypothetical protein HPB51_028918 [Rhipicephalus microplus]|uniref:Uncharacterized protein n=1 Tax=Rhipicephalus microplus TaxID=6941 RepID=A0A9J6CW06_RHIMP|nr:hypothetical protein HPB51_028918 [Rhipicephalus microplus]
MQSIHRWFVLHDTSNTTQHIHKKWPDTRQFDDAEYARLEWLEVTLPVYLDELEKSCRSQKEFSTKETYGAFLLTTYSMVACIKYLLKKEKFLFVLTQMLFRVLNVITVDHRLANSLVGRLTWTHSDQAVNGSESSHKAEYLASGRSFEQGWNRAKLSSRPGPRHCASVTSVAEGCTPSSHRLAYPNLDITHTYGYARIPYPLDLNLLKD